MIEPGLRLAAAGTPSGPRRQPRAWFNLKMNARFNLVVSCCGSARVVEAMRLYGQRRCTGVSSAILCLFSWRSTPLAPILLHLRLRFAPSRSRNFRSRKGTLLLLSTRRRRFHGIRAAVPGMKKRGWGRSYDSRSRASIGR